MYVDNVCPQKTIATPLQKIEKSEMAFEKKKYNKRLEKLDLNFRFTKQKVY